MITKKPCNPIVPEHILVDTLKVYVIEEKKLLLRIQLFIPNYF